ncbi:MAG: hypothetical protein KJ804_03160 [Proteobacteria bacterium]|nr:hypothetical protein [Pseudomonadota bacterium]
MREKVSPLFAGSAAATTGLTSPTFTFGNATMTRAELLLKKSLGHYQEILEKMGAIQYAMASSDPETIRTISAAIDEAQDKAKQIEQELAPFFEQAPELLQSPQFLDRLSLIRAILKLTDSQTPRIEAIMAINRNEMRKIVRGRAVVGTYYPSAGNKGGLINSSS